ncbi:MAG: hypothetical protein AAFO77_10165 [Pseudomonadota bacterium]
MRHGKEVWPIRIQSYYGIELFWDLGDEIYVAAEGPDGLLSELSGEAAKLGMEIMALHDSLLTSETQERFRADLDECRTERERWWRLFDKFVGLCKQEFDPQKYEVIETLGPDPNPFG